MTRVSERTKTLAKQRIKRALIERMSQRSAKKAIDPGAYRKFVESFENYNMLYSLLDTSKDWEYDLSQYEGSEYLNLADIAKRVSSIDKSNIWAIINTLSQLINQYENENR
jgi:hypothetical protein